MLAQAARAFRSFIGLPPAPGAAEGARAQRGLQASDSYERGRRSATQGARPTKKLSGPAAYRAAIASMDAAEAYAKGHAAHASDVRDLIPHIETMLRRSARQLHAMDDPGLQASAKKLMAAIRDDAAPLSSASWIGLHEVNAKDTPRPRRPAVMTSTQRFHHMHDVFQKVRSSLRSRVEAYAG